MVNTISIAKGNRLDYSSTKIPMVTHLRKRMQVNQLLYPETAF